MTHALGILLSEMVFALLPKEKRVLWWIPGFLFFVCVRIAIVEISALLWINLLILILAYFHIAYFGNWKRQKILIQ